jgi:aspartyl-tRNA synthetase
MPQNLVGMLTSLSNPIVEAFKITLNTDPEGVRALVKEFMESSEAIPFQENPDGAPGIFVYDPRKPIEGLQAFGHEGSEALKETFLSDVSTDQQQSSREAFDEGDLIVIQARSRAPLSGGSTALGRLRTAIYKQAMNKGLVDSDSTPMFLWVTDFPLFTPNNDSDPGQGGLSGFSSTHHPFTAPKTAADVDLLLTDPELVKADHYDLVLNGVELGGGSRRIHNSEMQQFIMRDILKVLDAYGDSIVNKADIAINR